ncbi:hypothetical protein B0H11DRAFT_1900566 [Mycena galericulata]|nr:hypothetical protein B0H11DRAFT_1900566 [Mycena galericulata]
MARGASFVLEIVGGWDEAVAIVLGLFGNRRLCADWAGRQARGRALGLCRLRIHFSELMATAMFLGQEFRVIITRRKKTGQCWCNLSSSMLNNTPMERATAFNRRVVVSRADFVQGCEDNRSHPNKINHVVPWPAKLKPLKEVLNRLIMQLKNEPGPGPGYFDLIKWPMYLGTMTTKPSPDDIAPWKTLRRHARQRHSLGPDQGSNALFTHALRAHRLLRRVVAYLALPDLRVLVQRLRDALLRDRFGDMPRTEVEPRLDVLCTRERIADGGKHLKCRRENNSKARKPSSRGVEGSRGEVCSSEAPPLHNVALRANQKHPISSTVRAARVARRRVRCDLEALSSPMTPHAQTTRQPTSALSSDIFANVKALKLLIHGRKAQRFLRDIFTTGYASTDHNQASETSRANEHTFGMFTSPFLILDSDSVSKIEMDVKAGRALTKSLRPARVLSSEHPEGVPSATRAAALLRLDEDLAAAKAFVPTRLRQNDFANVGSLYRRKGTGKRYKPKKERMRVEKMGPPYIFNGCLACIGARNSEEDSSVNSLTASIGEPKASLAILLSVFRWTKASLAHLPFAYSRAIDHAIAWIVRSRQLRSFSVVVVQRKDGRSLSCREKGAGYHHAQRRGGEPSIGRRARLAVQQTPLLQILLPRQMRLRSSFDHRTFDPNPLSVHASNGIEGYTPCFLQEKAIAKDSSSRSKDEPRLDVSIPTFFTVDNKYKNLIKLG